MVEQTATPLFSDEVVADAVRHAVVVLRSAPPEFGDPDEWKTVAEVAVRAALDTDMVRAEVQRREHVEYRNGENNHAADWEIAFGEHCDFPDDVNCEHPTEVARYIERLQEQVAVLGASVQEHATTCLQFAATITRVEKAVAQHPRAAQRIAARPFDPPGPPGSLRPFGVLLNEYRPKVREIVHELAQSASRPSGEGYDEREVEGCTDAILNLLGEYGRASAGDDAPTADDVADSGEYATAGRDFGRGVATMASRVQAALAAGAEHV